MQVPGASISLSVSLSSTYFYQKWKNSKKAVFAISRREHGDAMQNKSKNLQEYLQQCPQL